MLLEVACVNCTCIDGFNWKIPCEVEFGDTLDAHYLKHKIYQRVRVCYQIMSFPNHSQFLGVAQDSGNALNFLFKIEKEGKKKLYFRSVIQNQFPEEIHPPIVRLKVVLSILFKDSVSRKRENDSANKPSRWRKTLEITTT